MIRGKTQIWENRVGIKRNTNFFFYEIWWNPCTTSLEAKLVCPNCSSTGFLCCMVCTLMGSSWLVYWVRPLPETWDFVVLYGFCLVCCFVTMATVTARALGLASLEADP
jgi:hypothetical protein